MTKVKTTSNWVPAAERIYCLDGERVKMRWKLKGETLTMRAEGQESKGTLEDDVITMKFYGVDITMTFVKEGAALPTMEPTTEQPVTEPATEQPATESTTEVTYPFCRFFRHIGISGPATGTAGGIYPTEQRPMKIGPAIGGTAVSGSNWMKPARATWLFGTKMALLTN